MYAYYLFDLMSPSLRLCPKMAQTVIVFISLFFNLFSSLFFLPSIASISSGFRLKLTHRDSPNSPLYQPNLSDFERFKKNIKISKYRASYFHQLSRKRGNQNSSKPKQVPAPFQLPLTNHEPIFTVEIGLGTPVVKRTLIFDTGSGLTWTQCKPCMQCFKQRQPLFDIHKSSSFRLMSRHSKLAKDFTCTTFECVYFVEYLSGQSSEGVVVMEDFTFQTNAGFSKKVSGLVFGCGTNNRGMFGPDNIASGLFGLDRRPVSFARQLGGLIKNRFSYCLQNKASNTKESYLRFGDEAIVRGKNAKSEPFLWTMGNEQEYLLNLRDISIGGQKLGLEKGTFPGGCHVDSGCAVSVLNRKSFSVVERFVTGYFSKFKNVSRIMWKGVAKELFCYTRPVELMKFPNLTFHFQGADFRVPSSNLFYIQREFFCLAMLASNDRTVLGAYQQRNVRMVYDLKKEMLSFAPEDCSQDAASLSSKFYRL